MRGQLRWNFLLLVTIGFLSAVACKPPADEEALNQMQGQIDDQKSSQAQLKASVEEQIDRIDAIEIKMDNAERMLKQGAAGGAGVSGQQAQQIDGRIRALEAQVAQLKAAAAQPAGAGRSARAIEAPPEVVEAQPVTPTTGPTTRGIRQGTAARRPRTAGTVEKAAPPRRAGTYHTVKEGETFEGIARQYGMSPDELRKANNIPAGRTVTVRPGTRYWVFTGR